MKHPKYKSASIFAIIPFTFITVTIIAVLIAVFTVLDSPAELVGASIDSVLNHHLNHLLQIAFAALSVVLFFYIYFLHKLRKSFQALIETSEKFIAGDIEQRVNCQNVSRFSKSIAQQLQLSEAAVRRTSEAGYFHDIGNIAV